MMEPGNRRQVRKPTVNWRELAVIVLGLLCLAGQAVVYRGPHPSSAARVAVIVLGVAVFGCMFLFAGMVLRRERAARRSLGG